MEQIAAVTRQRGQGDGCGGDRHRWVSQVNIDNIGRAGGGQVQRVGEQGGQAVRPGLGWRPTAMPDQVGVGHGGLAVDHQTIHQ